MLKPPCKDCPDRYVGCHSTCEKYIAYDKSRKELYAQRDKRYQLESDIYMVALTKKKKVHKNENNNIRR